MSKVKITNGSLDGSELTNAASESTLAELLVVMKAMSKQAGTNSKKSAKELDNLAKSAKASSDSIDENTEARLRWNTALVKGFKILGQGIVNFAGSLDSAANNLINFGADLIDSQPEITDFTGSLASSRLNILGMGTAVHRLTELIMGNYRSFQNLSQSGIFLGDRISSLQSDFAGLGIDARTLTSAIADNAEQFAMNGSASVAAARALDGMRTITNDTRNELLSYGINLEEQTEIFTAMYARNTRALRLGLTTTDEINQQSATYAKSLRLISELTGVSAREIEDQQKRLDQEHAFQLKLRQLEQDGQSEAANKLRAYVAYMENSLQEGGRDIAIAQTIGTEATTDAAIGLRGYMNGVDNFSNEMFRATMDGNLTADQFREYFTERGKELGEMQVLGRDLSTAQQLINMGEGQVVGAILRFVRTFDDESDKIMSNLGEVDSAGDAAMNFETAMVSVRQGFADLATKFFANDTVQAGIEKFSEWISNFADWVETADFSDLSQIVRDGISYLWEETSVIHAMIAGIALLWGGKALATAMVAGVARMAGAAVISILKMNPLTLAAAFALTPTQLGDGTVSGPIEQSMASEGLTPDSMGDEEFYNERERRISEFFENLDFEGSAETMARDYAENIINAMSSESERVARSQAGENEYTGFERRGQRSSIQKMQQQREELLRYIDSVADTGIDLSGLIDLIPEIPVRKIGTLQATGMRSEPKDTVAQIHAGERVLNAEETNEYNNRTNQNNQRPMLEKLDQLNSTMMTVASLLTQELSIQTRTMNRISGLGPDLMKGMP